MLNLKMKHVNSIMVVVESGEDNDDGWEKESELVG
jgi:hypothetical protein